MSGDWERTLLRGLDWWHSERAPSLSGRSLQRTAGAKLRARVVAPAGSWSDGESVIEASRR